MDFKNMTPIVVRSFHYDLNDEQKVKNEVNVSLRQVYQDLEDGSQDEGKNGKYFEIAVPFEVPPAPGDFTVSGVITRVVQFVDYFGDGSDLEPSEYQLLSRPLVEEIETLTYEITQLTLDHPVNLSFKSNFNELNKDNQKDKDDK